MTVLFQNKTKGNIVRVEDVKHLTTRELWYGITGFGVTYENGTFNLFDNDIWELRSVLTKEN